MRTDLRLAFNLSAALSLLLSAAILLLWVRSDRTGYFLEWSRPLTKVQLAASRGAAWVYVARVDVVEPNGGSPGFQVQEFTPPQDPRQWGYGPRDLPYAFDGAGFAYGAGAYRGYPMRRVTLAIVPCWALMLASMILPALFVRRGFQRRRLAARKNAGFCVHCGYDLRASPNRCPECGAAISAIHSG